MAFTATSNSKYAPSEKSSNVLELWSDTPHTFHAFQVHTYDDYIVKYVWVGCLWCLPIVAVHTDAVARQKVHWLSSRTSSFRMIRSLIISPIHCPPFLSGHHPKKPPGCCLEKHDVRYPKTDASQLHTAHSRYWPSSSSASTYTCTFSTAPCIQGP